MKKIYYTILILSVRVSFAQTPYKIGMYELMVRNSYDSNYKEIKRYEIRSLFAKSSDEWVVDSNYEKKDFFYLVTRGKIINKLYGYRELDTIRFPADKNVYYFPKPKIVLGKSFNLDVSKRDPADILQSVCVSNNSVFKQNNILKNYKPGSKDIQLLKDSFYTYIKRQYCENCQSVMHESPSINFLNDSLLKEILHPDEMTIDAKNTFIDDKGNKLITFFVPYDLRFSNEYPFNESCFREDNGYFKKGFRITCTITHNDELIFLRDELEYIDHGDFDGDGKDEYLFWYGIFNHVGYVLYYNDFKETTDFMWSYH